MQGTTYRNIISRLPLAPLGRLTVASLLGDALSFATLLLTILITAGIVVQPLLIITIALFLIAATVATGIRWTPLLATFMGLGTMIGGVFTQQYFVYHLAHPAEVVPFILCLLICVFAIVAIFTGLGATIQNYTDSTRQAPRWLPLPLAALGGFIVGTLLVSLLVQATPVSSTTTSIGGEATVHMGISTFTQSSVTVSKGSKLKLIDDGSFLHILSNGTWENNTPHPALEAGAPSVQNVQVNGNTIEIGPFNTAGTFHIYCTVHPGMNLTVIVQ